MPRWSTATDEEKDKMIEAVEATTGTLLPDDFAVVERKDRVDVLTTSLRVSTSTAYRIDQQMRDQPWMVDGVGTMASSAQNYAANIYPAEMQARREAGYVKAAEYGARPAMPGKKRGRPLKGS